MTRESQAAAKLQARLTALERRRRMLSLAGATAACLAALLPAAAVFCAVDWYSHMPLVARWLALAGLLGLTWFVLRRWWLPTLRRHQDPDQTALTVERRFPELADGVISSIQLERRTGQHGYGSEEMIRAAQAQSAERAGQLDFRAAQPLGKVLPVGLLALAMLAGWAYGTAKHPQIVAIWAARCFWNFSYPCQTRIDDWPRELVVARGDPAEIAVKAGGLLPSSGQIYLRSESSGWLPRELSSTGRRGRYAARIEEVVEPLRFRIKLGDAPEVEGRITVVSRPEVAGVSVTLEYPGYTRLPPETVKTGHFRCVPGTRARVTIQASKPLASGRLAFGEGGAGAPREMPLQLAADGATGAAEFPVEKSGDYAVHLADRQGFTNLSPVRYNVSAVPDALPRIILVRPGAEALATPASIIRLEYKISDDYGLRSGRLCFRLNEEKGWKSIPLPLPGVDPKKPEADIAQPGPRRAEQSFLWDLATLGFKIGDVITFRLEACDHAPRGDAPAPGLSPDREIRIVTEEVISKKLREDLENTAKVVEGVLNLERDSQERIRKLIEEIRKEQK